MKTIANSYRSLLVIVILISTPLIAFGQQFQYATPQAEKLPSFYFGAGLGVNDYGIGLKMEVPVYERITVDGNIGLGGWGLKLGGNINFYPDNFTRGQELSLGFSTASGMNGLETDLEVEPNDETQKVTMDLYRVNTINAIYTINLKVGRTGKIGFSGGYAISLTKEAYQVTSGVLLNDMSKQVMNIMQPGGLILGIKFVIGL